ncbi:hypothetical protein [Actinomadura sp. HBU206391]|uniref:hypothetical protein n=1 Tax=Actinomadura sp. HBU206391 TaxID=2731692 RepID=UPI001650C67E|nr:hypothetical protein [Actinomadura sp. HBU206391]MBC6458025.1 hypothetical protein [Actinomadura sp. HBU206391]
MCDLGRVLRLDARRTALLFAVPVLAAVGLPAAWRALIPGVAYWDNAVMAVSASARLLGPAAAALAAWIGMRERRLDYLRGLTVRSPATGPLIDLALLTAATLAAYCVVTMVIVGQTVLREEAGRFRPLGALVGAATLLLYVVIGYLAGRLVPRLPTVPATAVAAGLWIWLRHRGQSWWSLLPPADLGHVELFAYPRTGVLAHQVLWSLGLSTALVLGYVLVANRRELSTLPLAVPLVTALVVTAISTKRLHDYDGVAVLPSPTGLTCREWPLTVCVHPALRTALPSLVAEVTPLAARLTGTPGAFIRVEQRPEREPASIEDGVARIHLSDLADGYEQRVEDEIRTGLVDMRTCADPRRARGAAYTLMVNAWLLDHEPQNAPATAAARRFASWDEQQRRAWLRLHFADYRRCALAEADFR